MQAVIFGHMTDTELLDVMGKHGISVEFVRDPNPKKKGLEWMVWVPGLRGVSQRFRSPREAIQQAYQECLEAGEIDEHGNT